MSDSPVLLVTAKVRFGQEGAFSAWQTRHNLAIANFPGFRSSDVIPGGAAGSNEWTIVVNFQTPDQLRIWQHSAERAELVAESAAFLDAGHLQRRKTEPFEYEDRTWLPIIFPGWTPGDSVTGKGPPGWKICLLVLLGFFPISMIAAFLLELLPLHSVMAVFFGIAIGVFLTGFGAMPLFVRGFGWWLFPEPDTSAKSLQGIALLGLLYVIEVAILWNWAPW